MNDIKIPAGFIQRASFEVTQVGDIRLDQEAKKWITIREDSAELGTDVGNVYVCHPDPVFWRDRAMALYKDVEFALANLKTQGSGVLMNLKTGERRHWRDRFMDNLEAVGIEKFDRDYVHALDWPKRQREKFLKEREKQQQANDDAQRKAAGSTGA